MILREDSRQEESRDTGTLGKLMAVLELVAHADGPMRFTDILAKTVQPRGTLHRQLGHLVEEGLLELDSQARYTPGLRLLSLASRTWARNELRSVAEPHLRLLHDLTGETVHLAVLRGTEIVYLDKVEGRQSVRMHSEIGNASPLHCTGVGKAVLAVLDHQSLSSILESLELKIFTENTHGSVETLLADLQEIRTRGYAFDLEEHEAGIRCVAAPVSSPDLSFVAGISVTGPAYRVSFEKLNEWAEPVRHAAENMVHDMRVRLGPRR